MFAEALEHAVSLTRSHFTRKFSQCKMHDIVMMQLLAGQIGTQLKPDVMKQVDLFRSEMGRMRAEVENALFTTWREYVQRDARTRLRHALPSDADLTRLLIDGHL